MKTDALIDLLSEDAAPRVRFGTIFSVALAVGIVIAGAIFFSSLGLRPGILQAAETIRFLFKFVIVVSLAVIAIGGALRLSRPDASLGGWTAGLIAIPVLLGGAVIAELLALPESAWITQLVGHNARHCVTLIPLMAIGPLVCLIVALRRGAPANPGLAGAIAGLASAGVAAIFYASNCPDDSPLFVATWYSIATLVVVAAGYAAGTKFLRW